MNEDLAKEYVAILNRYNAGEISAEQALIEIEVAVANSNEDDPENKIEI